MIREFAAILTLFRQGKELANAAVWKQRTVVANLLVSVMGAALLIARGAGYGIDIDDDTLQALAGGIAAAVAVGNAVMATISSKRVGIKAKQEEPLSSGET